MMWWEYSTGWSGVLTAAFLFAGCGNSAGHTDLSKDFLGRPDQAASEQELVWQRNLTDEPSAPTIDVIGDEMILSLSGFYLGSKTVDGTEYSQVVLPGHPPLTRVGFPELPKVRANMIVPHDVPVTVEVLDEQHYDIETAPPLPSRGSISRNVDPATVPYEPSEFYESGDRYPDAHVDAGTPFVLRDYRGQPVQFQPFVYFRADNRLRVYTRIHVRVVAAEQSIYTRRRETHEFGNVYDGAFANYGLVSYRSDDASEPGRMLILTADAYYDAVVPLMEWKIQRGIDAEIVKLSAVGSSANDIKSFVKEQYESSESLVYLILVGDSDTVPTLRGTYESAHSDPCYAMVDGDDSHPDFFISRISARSEQQVSTQVAKFIGYEREPDLDGNWYSRGVGVASDEGEWSGKIDYQRADGLGSALKSYGYSSVAKVYDPGAKKSDLINEINEGVSIVNYLGHGSGSSWETTGMSVSDMGQLSNGNRMPIVVDVSCQNGSFVRSETCFAESWLRAGTPSQSAGAVAMYSASTDTDWLPPTVMQEWIVNELIVKEMRFTAGALYFGGAMKVFDAYSGSEGIQLIEQYNLFGDASLMVRTQAPKELKVTHPAVAVSPGGVFDVEVEFADGTPVQFAVVALSNSDSEFVASMRADGRGAASLSYSGIGADGVLLTVVAHNAVPYVVEVPSKAPLGGLCAGPEYCQSGFCADGICCESQCEATCMACDVPGSVGHCATAIDDTPCQDENLCNGEETCQAGACQSGPELDCSDNDLCTADSCDPQAGCKHEAEVCKDNSACTEDSCDPAIGCTFENVADQTSCGGGEVCGPASCHEGLCLPDDSSRCDDGNPCTLDLCDEASGCAHVPSKDDPACDTTIVGDFGCQSAPTPGGPAQWVFMAVMLWLTFLRRYS